MARVGLTISLLCSAFAQGAIVRRTSPTVQLDYATYQGVRLDAGVDQYLGMRFAAPPLGDLRFRAPQDPENASTIQDASAFRSTCVGTGQDVVTGVVEEDCLFVNVFTPSNAKPTSKLPVWVYIQGGGYATNSNANYNGTDVIQNSGNGIVFVNFNYRVGLLGFLASQEVIDNGDLNAGLLDQRKVLEWVQKYISLFGGDPGHVVIQGASAGAGSVAHHLAAYNGRDDGLFVGAVPESTFWPTQRTVAEMQSQYDLVAQNTSCVGTTDTLTCLRAMDISKIQAVNVQSPFPGAPSEPLPLWYFLPVVDGTFITGQLYDSFQNGEIVKVPLLVGDDTNEGTDFAYNASTQGEVSAFLQANYPGLNATQLQEINGVYPLMAPFVLHAAYFPSASAAYGESTFTCPGNHMAAGMAAYLSPDQVWNYRWNVQDPEYTSQGLGVPHTTETTAIFGYPYSANETSYAPGGLDAPMIPITMDYFISFVTTLNPNTQKNTAAPTWDSWGSGTTGNRLKFELNATAMEAIPQDQQQRCEFWQSLAPSMQI